MINYNGNRLHYYDISGVYANNASTIYNNGTPYIYLGTNASDFHTTPLMCPIDPTTGIIQPCDVLKNQNNVQAVQGSYGGSAFTRFNGKVFTVKSDPIGILIQQDTNNSNADGLIWAPLLANGNINSTQQKFTALSFYDGISEAFGSLFLGTHGSANVTIITGYWLGQNGWTLGNALNINNQGGHNNEQGLRTAAGDMLYNINPSYGNIGQYSWNRLTGTISLVAFYSKSVVTDPATVALGTWNLNPDFVSLP